MKRLVLVSILAACGSTPKTVVPAPLLHGGDAGLAERLSIEELRRRLRERPGSKQERDGRDGQQPHHTFLPSSA